MSDDDRYHDDSMESHGNHRSVRSVSSLLAVVISIFGAGLYIQSTLAANVSLNSGGAIQFGQGVVRTVACSGTQSLIVTPLSSFVNVSGGGSHKFSAIKVDNIPTTCRDQDFTFFAYNNVSGSAAQAIFNTSSTRAVVQMKNNDTFEVGAGGSGLSVTTNSSSSFTVTFTSPVGDSSATNKLTVETSSHTATCAEGGNCVLGDVGSGGGTVFYVPAGGFTVAGSPCNTRCRYLEWAPNTWSGGTQDPSLAWSSDFTNAVNTTGTAIGTGFSNTTKILTSNSPYVADTSQAAFQAKAYRGGGKSDWFLPSYDELMEVSTYARAVSATGFSANYYVSSSEIVYGLSGTDTRFSTLRLSDSAGSQNYKNDSAPTRPIRAF